MNVNMKNLLFIEKKNRSSPMLNKLEQLEDAIFTPSSCANDDIFKRQQQTEVKSEWEKERDKERKEEEKRRYVEVKKIQRRRY